MADASKLERGERGEAPRKKILNVRVDDREHARATTLAARKGKTVGAVVRELLDEEADEEGVSQQPTAKELRRAVAEAEAEMAEKKPRRTG